LAKEDCSAFSATVDTIDLSWANLTCFMASWSRCLWASTW